MQFNKQVMKEDIAAFYTAAQDVTTKLGDVEYELKAIRDFHDQIALLGPTPDMPDPSTGMALDGPLLTIEECQRVVAVNAAKTKLKEQYAQFQIVQKQYNLVGVEYQELKKKYGWLKEVEPRAVFVMGNIHYCVLDMQALHRAVIVLYTSEVNRKW